MISSKPLFIRSFCLLLLGMTLIVCLQNGCTLGSTGPCKVDKDCEVHRPIKLYCTRNWCVPLAVKRWADRQDRISKDGGSSETDPKGPCEPGETRVCYTGPSHTRDKGICKSGLEICKDGVWSLCTKEILPQAKDDCDEKDNDCDGDIDEDCTCKEKASRSCYPPSTLGCTQSNGGFQCAAPCKAGTQKCINNQWGACIGAALPQTRQCDGKDNDCDGKVDEECAQTFAGVIGQSGSGTSDVPLTQKYFNSPLLLSEKNGILYILDWKNKSLRTIDLKKKDKIEHITDQLPDSVGGLAVDSKGNAYLSDYAKHIIYKVTLGGRITIYAGQKEQSGSDDSTVPTNATFNSPKGLVIDDKDHLYIADSENHLIRKIVPDKGVSTFAGQVGKSGATDHPSDPKQALFDTPHALFFAQGNLYISESTSRKLRTIKLSTGTVQTLGKLTHFIQSLAIDTKGRTYLTLKSKHMIYQFSGVLSQNTIFSGQKQHGTQNGSKKKAQFYNPYGLAIHQDMLYIADTNNHCIRKIPLEQ